MSAPPRVLVIDDDEAIVEFLRRALTYAGFAVDTATRGTEGLERFRARPPDVVVLDVLMPDLDGFAVCQRLRQISDVPVLMLTARDEVPDRVRGLESGADDYLVKPFALGELVARLRALLRRRAPQASRKLRFADLEVDLLTREVYRGSRRIELTAREFDLLVTFLRHPRQVLSRGQLLEHVWGVPADIDSHVVEVYIRYLRQKLEAGGEPRLIHTVRGAGYALREPPP